MTNDKWGATGTAPRTTMTGRCYAAVTVISNGRPDR